MKEINIYTIDKYNNHLYEFTTKLKDLNCKQVQMKVVANNNLLSNVLKHTSKMVYFKEPINDKSIFKNNNVIKLYASYK